MAGHGAPLLCLHGSGESKELWESTGWLPLLAQSYTVIAPDLRGFGHSTVYRDAEHYAIERILADLTGVAAACGAEEFRLFGHSYGATIAFQAVAAGLPVTKVVCASGSIGRTYFEEFCPEQQAEYALLAQAKRDGSLQTLSQYSQEELEFIKQEDMEKFAALFGAWSRWKPVAPGKLAGRVSLYSGTKDFNQEMVENTTTNRAVFQANGIDTFCFDGLTHDALISEKSIVSAWVLEHLV